MSKIIDTALSGYTIKYGPVQFGGSDATTIAIVGEGEDPAVALKGLPPMYAFRSQFRYDDAHRTVIGVDYVLTVRCIFYGPNNVALAQNVTSLKKYLSLPRQVLRIEGLGVGFGNVAKEFPAGTPGNTIDLEYGPKPLSLSMEPVGGNKAWELTWEVQFFVSEAIGLSNQANVIGTNWMAFNCSSTWTNDFEGLPTRTIQGYIQFAQTTTDVKVLFKQPDEFRHTLTVVCPPNFRRVANSWRMNEARNRVLFNVVDEALPGDNFPPGISLAAGTFDIIANTADGLGMNRATVSLQMSLRVAPTQRPDLAFFYFMAVMLSKQLKLQGLDAQNKPRTTVIPMHFRLGTSYFDNQRTIQCAAVWMVTNAVTVDGKQESTQANPNNTTEPYWSNLNGILLAAEPFTPVSTTLTNVIGSNQGYGPWAASMIPMWKNRGVLNVQEIDVSPNLDTSILDLGNDKLAGVIGNISQDAFAYTAASLPSLGCPAIPPDGGWLHYQRRISTQREGFQSVHRRAETYLPETSLSAVSTDPTNLNKLRIASGMGTSNYPTNVRHVTEYHGKPRLLISISVSALRFKREPIFPVLRSVGGFAVNFLESDSHGLSADQAFDVYGCPVFRLEGEAVYEVSGAPTEFLRTWKPLDASSSTVPTDAPLEL